MEKRYIESVNGFCPYEEKNKTILIEFIEFPHLVGRKAMSLRCETAAQCPYQNKCPIYLSTQ